MKSVTPAVTRFERRDVTVGVTDEHTTQTQDVTRAVTGRNATGAQGVTPPYIGGVTPSPPTRGRAAQ
jgi:hypothetical protein